jgi:hypothetical protein
LGEEVRSRTQLGHVSANRKYSADYRIRGGASHLLINRRPGYREIVVRAVLKAFGPIREATRCPLVYISQGQPTSEKSGCWWAKVCRN